MASSGRAWRVAVVCAGISVGIASIVVAFAPWQVVSWAGDLLTGWVLIGAGVLGMSRASTSRIGALLAIAGFAWFLGDFAVLGGAAGWIAGMLMWAYHGVLFQAILTVPSGRRLSRFQGVAVAIGYTLSLVPWVWTNAVPAIIASLAAVGAAAMEYSVSQGVRRRSKRRALEASALMAGSTAIAFALRGVVASPLASLTAMVACELAIAAAAVLLVLAAEAMNRGGELADTVIELDDAGGIGLEGALRRELGDPRLTITYADAVLSDDPTRESLRIDLEDGGTAVLTVVEGALGEGSLRESVAAAIRLDAANRTLRVDVATQVEAVRASRTRLIRAADDAGRELEERLHAGADQHLAALERLLHDCEAGEAKWTIDEPLTAARALLVDARDDLTRFSAGLHPRALDQLGLEGALGIAASESRISVELEVATDGRVTADVQLAAYFFCLEGLANIAKHASARRASVRVVAAEGELTLEVADDGAGGAAPGSGIQGIADRIASLGGVLTLESHRGAGTRLIARVPLEESPLAAAEVMP